MADGKNVWIRSVWIFLEQQTESAAFVDRFTTPAVSIFEHFVNACATFALQKSAQNITRSIERVQCRVWYSWQG